MVSIQSLDCDDPKTPGGPSEALYVQMQYNKDFKSAAEFYYQTGFTQASYIINATQGHARIIRDVYLGGLQYQTAGQDAALAKCSDCKVVASVEWVDSEAGPSGVLNQKFRTALVRHPEANAVLLTHDSLATSFGISKMIRDAGRADSMIVVGGEGYATAQQLIRDRAGLTADVGQSTEWMAWGAVDTLNRLFNGRPPVPQGIGLRVIDVNHNLSPEGQDYSPPNPPIDLEGTYLKSWGIK